MIVVNHCNVTVVDCCCCCIALAYTILQQLNNVGYCLAIMRPKYSITAFQSNLSRSLHHLDVNISAIDYSKERKALQVVQDIENPNRAASICTALFVHHVFK